jgi:hypothetical protein
MGPPQLAPVPMRPLSDSIAVPVAVGAEVAVEGGCYWVKRKFSTSDGYVLRYVKVCEVIEADQP